MPINPSGTRAASFEDILLQLHQMSTDDVAYDSNEIVNLLYTLIEKATGASRWTLGPRQAAYSAAVMQDSPLLYWRFGEAASTTQCLDSTTGNRRGLKSGAITSVAGALSLDTNTTYSFDGTSGYIDAETSTLDVSGTNSFTFECLVKPSTVDATYRRILGFETATNQGCFLAYQSSDGFLVVRGDSGGANDGAKSFSTPSTSVWTHVVGTYDGTTLRLYTNGSLVASPASSRSAAPGTSTLQVAKTYSSGFPGTAGAIGEVALYSTALSAARVLAHYAASLIASPQWGIPDPPSAAIPSFGPWLNRPGGRTRRTPQRGSGQNYSAGRWSLSLWS